MSGTMIFFLLIIYVVTSIWVWCDAADKNGKHLGAIWGLIAFSTFPFAFIVYLFVRNASIPQ